MSKLDFKVVKGLEPALRARNSTVSEAKVTIATHNFLALEICLNVLSVPQFCCKETVKNGKISVKDENIVIASKSNADP
jgi:hypothetical protein